MNLLGSCFDKRMLVLWCYSNDFDSITKTRKHDRNKTHPFKTIWVHHYPRISKSANAKASCFQSTSSIVLVGSIRSLLSTSVYVFMPFESLLSCSASPFGPAELKKQLAGSPLLLFKKQPLQRIRDLSKTNCLYHWKNLQLAEQWESSGVTTLPNIFGGLFEEQIPIWTSDIYPNKPKKTPQKSNFFWQTIIWPWVKKYRVPQKNNYWLKGKIDPATCGFTSGVFVFWPMKPATTSQILCRANVRRHLLGPKNGFATGGRLGRL